MNSEMEGVGQSAPQATLGELAQEARQSERDRDAKMLLDIHGIGVDAYLQRLVTLSNTDDLKLEASVTLYVEGTVVTGTLTSYKNFLLETATAIANGLPGDEESRGRMKDALLIGTALDPSVGDVDSADQQDPYYIHLRNAQFIDATGASAPTGGTWWRGRISAVSAWHLGKLSKG